jgi:hypothetical protein
VCVCVFCFFFHLQYLTYVLYMVHVLYMVRYISSSAMPIHTCIPTHIRLATTTENTVFHGGDIELTYLEGLLTHVTEEVTSLL